MDIIANTEMFTSKLYDYHIEYDRKEKRYRIYTGHGSVNLLKFHTKKEAEDYLTVAKRDNYAMIFERKPNVNR